MKISEWMFWSKVKSDGFFVVSTSPFLIRADRGKPPLTECLFLWKDYNRTEHVYYHHHARHRENLPAHYVYVDDKLVCQMYCIDGALHREDGPAIEKFDDAGRIYAKTYFRHGQRYSK